MILSCKWLPLQVAEKRKSLLDELAIKYQEESDQHREAVRTMEETHRKEVEELSQHIDEQQVRGHVALVIDRY